MQQLTISDFDYFVRYIKKKAKEYIGKYPENIKSSCVPDFFNKKHRDLKTGIWNIASAHTPTSSQIMIWNHENIKALISKIHDDRILFFKNNCPIYYPIIEAVLNNNSSILLKLKNEYIKIINNSPLDNVHKYYELGCSLLTENFSVIVTNPYNQNVDICFEKVFFDDIKNISINRNNRFNIDSNLMFFGLYIVIRTEQCKEFNEIKIGNKDFTVCVEKYSNTLHTEEIVCRKILRLLAPTSITYFTCDCRPEGEYEGTSLCVSVPTEVINIYYTSVIKKQEKLALIRDYKYFYNKCIEYNIIDYKNKREISPFYVAFEKYEEAINTNPNEYEKIITFIVIGLEALFTSKNVDLSYALKMRLTTFLDIIGERKENTKDILKIAYNIRCDYAHGGIDREKTTKKIMSLFKNQGQFILYLLNILRVSLVAILILDLGKRGNSNNKASANIEKFQDTLDEIMIGNLNLKNNIKGKLKPYKIWLKISEKNIYPH